jgi:membrane-bound metal-dependent hydrolase YbcI (DUF457 family)
MGRSHALSGWCAGLVMAPLVGLRTMAEVLPFATAAAGFALVPDLDHPGGSASRFLGPVTGLVSRLLRFLSRMLYALTKGPKDEDCEGTHRHFSHTVVFAVGLGWAATGLSTLGGGWAVCGIIAFGLLLGAHVLGDWLIVVAAAAVGTTAWQGGLHEAMAASTGWIGLAVALGCVVHCLGDALTRAGCPFLWPIPIAGETWYEIRPPRWFRFRTGGRVEQLLIFPAFGLAAILLMPGVWSQILTIASHANAQR